MKGSRFCLLIALALLPGGPVSLAQASPNQNPPTTAQNGPANGPSAALRTTTRLVQLNVIVQDNSGRPVHGLNKDDFILLDNGKPQTIALFSDESDAPQSSSSAGLLATPKLPPDVFGNRVHHESEVPGSVTVILFDALNTSLHDQSYAKSQILTFLKQLQPQDHVAIYLLTNRLTVINEFTQDSKSLLQAIERFQSYESVLLKTGNPQYVVPDDTGVKDPKAAAGLARLMNETSSMLSDRSNLDRVQITAQAIAAIANHAAGIPGRKNLVWVSGGFPISISFEASPNSPVDTQSQDFGSVIESVARAVNQSNLAIYPVDARGLLVPVQGDASLAHPFNAQTRADDIGAGQDEHATMNVLAARTGGRAFYNTNDIQGAIQRTLADSSSNYLIGFYPDHGDWNGQFHELKLKMRGSGLVLRYRTGYLALPNLPDTAAEASSALQAALWSPVDTTSLGILVKVAAIDNGSRKLDLRVKLDASELLLTETNARRAGKVDAIYLQLGPGDVILAADPLTYNLSFGEKEYRVVLKRGYELKESLLIRPTARALRIVVRDSGSGALGSVTIPLSNFLPPQSASN